MKIFPVHSQQKTLNIIADFADWMCKDIPLQGQEKGIELTGNAKAELNGIIKKFVASGIDAAVKYQKKGWAWGSVTEA